MKKILLPTDFSDIALNAILTAIKLQHNTPCHFILLHTYEPDTRNKSSRQNGTRTGMIYDALHQDALNKLEGTLNTIAKVSDYSGHTFSVRVARGNLATTISTFVPEHDLDLIVMGTKGATGTKRLFLGSNAVRVLKKVRNCPILVIPEKYNFQSLRNIVFPTEYAHFFSKGQLKPLREIAEGWRSQILVFHVAQEFKLSEQQMANKKILKERLDPIKHTFYNVTIQSTVSEAITEFASEHSTDMICLIHYGHTLMEKLTQEPVVKSVGFHTDVPLLILPE